MSTAIDLLKLGACGALLTHLASWDVCWKYMALAIVISLAGDGLKHLARRPT